MQLQSNSTNACGHHAIAYCLLKMSNLSNRDFPSLYSYDLLKNDCMVSECVQMCWGNI